MKGSRESCGTHRAALWERCLTSPVPVVEFEVTERPLDAPPLPEMVLAFQFSQSFLDRFTRQDNPYPHFLQVEFHESNYTGFGESSRGLSDTGHTRLHCANPNLHTRTLAGAKPPGC
jgi:hypothetical protein